MTPCAKHPSPALLIAALCLTALPTQPVQAQSAEATFFITSSQADLRSTGGDGLLYCFAVN